MQPGKETGFDNPSALRADQERTARESLKEALVEVSAIVVIGLGSAFLVLHYFFGLSMLLLFIYILGGTLAIAVQPLGNAIWFPKDMRITEDTLLFYFRYRKKPKSMKLREISHMSVYIHKQNPLRKRPVYLIQLFKKSRRWLSLDVSLGEGFYGELERTLRNLDIPITYTRRPPG